MGRFSRGNRVSVLCLLIGLHGNTKSKPMPNGNHTAETNAGVDSRPSIHTGPVSVVFLCRISERAKTRIGCYPITRFVVCFALLWSSQIGHAQDANRRPPLQTIRYEE